MEGIALAKDTQATNAIVSFEQSQGSEFPWKAVLLISVLYLAVAGLLLPLLPIGGSSEAREAKVIDVVRTTGEWILPLRNGVVPSKPPLFHWIGAWLASFDSATSELSARRPSVLAGLGVLWLAAGVAFRLSRLSPSPDLQKAAGLVAALATAVLSLTYGFYQMSTMAMVDMVFALFIWLALFAAVGFDKRRWQENESLSPAARYLFWCACALAVVARGPVGLVLPVLLVVSGAMSLCGWRIALRELFRPTLAWSFFVLPLAWYYLATKQGGDAFIDRQLLFENLRRIVGGEHMNSESWWFYLPSLARTTFPWWIPIIVLIPRSLRTFSTSRVVRGVSFPTEFRIQMLPLVLLFAGIFLFSIPSGKRHSYMLPLYPLIALQVALLVVAFASSGGYAFRETLLRGVRRMHSVLAFLAVLFVGVLGLVAHSSFFSSELVRGVQPFVSSIALPVGVLLLVGLVVSVTTRKVTLERELYICWANLFLFVSVSVCVGQGLKSSIKDYPGLTRQIQQIVAPGKRLAVVKDPFDEYFDPILYYLHSDVTVVDVNRSDLPCAVDTIYLARAPILEAARPRYAGTLATVATFREFGDRIRDNKNREIVAFTCSKSKPQANPSMV